MSTVSLYHIALPWNTRVGRRGEGGGGREEGREGGKRKKEKEGRERERENENGDLAGLLISIKKHNNFIIHSH